MRFKRISWLLGFSALALPELVLAQREPALKQIDVPHPYYYREMYLPQLTSGPSGATWSPDGKSLVFSQAGTLWLHELGSKTAAQLTSGSHYDYQPDWSPDGRYLVFSRYADDAMELALYDFSRKEIRALTRNGAVNVEPRWAPSGDQIAFVSTLYKRRWHLHVMPFKNDNPGEVERLSEDQESPLPRYYYSKFDHFLSPTWSPDGSELLFISNRGHLWGTGGVWRRSVRGGTGVEIRREETNWRTQPDWSRDGKRIVYSSYVGSQWHHLWLMTPDGQHPIQLTYGDFDATQPRWSPDGKRIAFVTNETGNLSLKILEVPGGAQKLVEIHKRTYLSPTADVSLSTSLPARISVTRQDGVGFGPSGSWMHTEDSFDRARQKFERSYFHTNGKARLTLPYGTYTIRALRGLEYAPVEKTVEVRRPHQSIAIHLSRIDHRAARGWLSGDLHVHMNYGGVYRSNSKSLVTQANAENLDVIENLIVNKEQRIPDVAIFGDKGHLAHAPYIFHNQEFHTNVWGHTSLLGLSSHLLLPTYSGYAGTAAASLHPMNAAIIDLGKGQGAIAGYVHPFDWDPEPANESVPLTHELPVDAALGKVDFMEIVGFSDHLATAKVWHRLLNCGLRIPAGAGTDAMTNFAQPRGPVGLNRVYAYVGKTLTQSNWNRAILSGNTFATNGPLLDFKVNGKALGSRLALARPSTVHVKGSVRSLVPVERIEILKNGAVIDSLVSAPTTRLSFSKTIPIEKSSWLALRAWSPQAHEPVADIYPYATTSPIYVNVRGEPITSPEDARFFLSWIGRLEKSTQASTTWNSKDELVASLALIHRARGFYQKQIPALSSEEKPRSSSSE